MALTEQGEQIIRLQAFVAASLDVIQLLTHTVASLGPDSYDRLRNGLGRIQGASGSWTLPAAQSAELSMVYAGHYEEACKQIAGGLHRMLTPQDGGPSSAQPRQGGA